MSECLGRWHGLQTLRQQSGALMLQVGKGEWSSLSQSPPWAVDAWGLGCLLQVLACQSSLLSPLFPAKIHTQRRKGAAVQLHVLGLVRTRRARSSEGNWETL